MIFRSFKQEKSSGLSLIQSLVSVAIVGSFTFVTYGWLDNAFENVNNVKCVSNLKTILVGARNFSIDRDGKIWTREEIGYSRYRMVDDPLGLPKLLEPYVPNLKVWLCPAGRKSLKKFGNNYSWTSTVAIESQPVHTLNNTPVIWDTYNYSLPSMFNASDDFKGDGTTPLGPSSLNSKYHLRPHFRQTSVNWGYTDGHVVSGYNSNRKN